MTTQLDQNLLYLQQNESLTYQMVKECMDNESQNSFELFVNENQSYNILCSEKEEYLLYSKYNPVHEATRWCESLKLEEDDNNDIILFGLGLTYHLSALMERYPNRKVFIYEPEIELFVETMKIVDISLLYGHPNIKYIAVGKDPSALHNFFEIVNKYCTLQYSFAHIPFYDKLSLDTQKLFLDTLREVGLHKKAVIGFHQTFGKIMYTNTLRNIPKMFKTPVLRTLKNQYEGSIALIIGGGPSLQYDIEQIKKAKNKWLLIAAGSSIQSLAHHGITPHLIVSMDPGIYNAKIFRANSFENVPLLMMPQLHHEVITLHNQNNVYAYYDNDVVVNYLIPYQDQDYIMKPTYSVTGTAIQAAAYMGATTIVLAGQDLSYPGNQKYSPGAAHIGEGELRQLDKELIYEIENVKETKNPTTFSMLQTLRDIEQLLASMDTIRIMNTSQLGANIQGSKFMDMETLIDESTSQQYQFDELTSILNNNPIYHDIDKLLIFDKLQNAIVFVATLMERIKWLEKELNNLNTFSRTNPTKGMTLLKKIESKLNQLFEEEIFVNFIKEWFIVEFNTFERQLLDIVKEPQLIKKTTIFVRILSPLLMKMKAELPGISAELIKTLEEIDASR